MERWVNKVALVTGGNSGCGLKILEELAKSGMIAVGFDLGDENIQKLKKEFESYEIHSIIGDVTCDNSVQTAFEFINENFGPCSVLINSAGIANNSGIFDSKTSVSDLQKCIDVNFTGTIRCAHHAYKNMEKSDIEGCIININSVGGHRVIDMGDCKLGVYFATKHAITASTELMRLELNNLKNRKVRVTSISPGLVDTNLFETSNLSENVLAQLTKKMEKLKVNDISDVVIYALSLPQRVNISELVIRATGCQF
jgi:NADP+-dependent farnesol dehydrogenase